MVIFKRLFSRIRLPSPPWKWSIYKLSRKIQDIEGVYDVMPEYAAPERYLLHVWAFLHDGLENKIRQVAWKRPRNVKIDVILYRREL